MLKQRIVLLAASFALTSALPMQAQWLGYPTPGVPRNPDGTVDLTAEAPRLDGKPDLSGVWHVETMTLEEAKRRFGESAGENELIGMEVTTISPYAINLFIDTDPEDIPIRPEAVTLMQQRRASGIDPGISCLPLGIPLNTLVSEYQKIVQTPQLILMVLELDGVRQVYMDGRELEDDPNPSWLGHSIGHWDGDTLVVETNGFNDRTWLDSAGHPHSESMRLTERYHRRDFGHLDIEITIDDPVMYTEPFSFSVTNLYQPDTDILEYYCAENEKDAEHARPSTSDTF